MSETTIFCSTNIISYTSIETYSSHVFRGKMTKNEEAKGVMFLSSFFHNFSLRGQKKGYNLYSLCFLEEGKFEKKILKNITLSSGSFNSSFGFDRHCVWMKTEIGNRVHDDPCRDHDGLDHLVAHDGRHDPDDLDLVHDGRGHGDLGHDHCGDYCWCNNHGLRHCRDFLGCSNPWKGVGD